MNAITNVVDRFVASFNEQDLDRTMTFFADNAEYLPGDGATHRGHTQIRAAFAPVFGGKSGLVTFDEDHRITGKYTYASFRRPIMYKEDVTR